MAVDASADVPRGNTLMGAGGAMLPPHPGGTSGICPLAAALRMVKKLV